ncbi:DUF1934 domain-containing protein [Paenibacillus sp. MBLB4367]|uniref:DUF1934 domain-containing protein n=1 Tax=Paenibacillus sp. MBLB4367 TaxID=3384767 RepID=UPI003907F461
MTDKRQVELLIVSESGGERIEQRVKADRYDKAGSVFLRYNEKESELGRTVTTVKIDHKQIRIIRHGDTRSEQTFVMSERLRGYYETAQGMMELHTETERLQVDLDGTPASVKWSYDLYVSGDHAGRYKLTMTLFEA